MKIGYALDETRDHRSEPLAQMSRLGRGVLQGIVQQACGDGIGIALNAGEDFGHGQGMDDIGLA